MQRKAPIDRLLEDYGETGFIVAEDDNIYKYAVECTEGTNLKIGALRLVRNPLSNSQHFVLEITGGNNGSPDWPQYLNDLSLFFTNAGKERRAWLIKLTNDCPDDVFDVYIGLKDKR